MSTKQCVVPSKQVENIVQGQKGRPYHICGYPDLVYEPKSYINILWRMKDNPEKYMFLTNIHSNDLNYINFKMFIKYANMKIRPENSNNTDKFSILTFNIGSQNTGDNLETFLTKFLRFYTKDFYNNQNNQNSMSIDGGGDKRKRISTSSRSSRSSRSPYIKKVKMNNCDQLDYSSPGNILPKLEKIDINTGDYDNDDKINFDIINLQELKREVYDKLILSDLDQNKVIKDDTTTNIPKKFTITLNGIEYLGIIAPRDTYNDYRNLKQSNQLKHYITLIKCSIIKEYKDDYKVVYMRNTYANISYYYLGLQLGSKIFINYHHQSKKLDQKNNFEAQLKFILNKSFSNQKIHDIVLCGDFNINSNTISKMQILKDNVAFKMINTTTNTHNTSCDSNDNEQTENHIIDHVIHISRTDIQSPTICKVDNPYWVFCNENDHNYLSAVVFTKKKIPDNIPKFVLIDQIEQFKQKSLNKTLKENSKDLIFYDRLTILRNDDDQKIFNSFIEEYNKNKNRISILSYNIGSKDINISGRLSKVSIGSFFQNLFNDFYIPKYNSERRSERNNNNYAKTDSNLIDFDFINIQECPAGIINNIIYMVDQSNGVYDNGVYVLDEIPVGNCKYTLLCAKKNFKVETFQTKYNVILVKSRIDILRNVYGPISTNPGCNDYYLGVVTFKNKLFLNVHLHSTRDCVVDFLNTITKNMSYTDIVISGDFNIEIKKLERYINETIIDSNIKKIIYNHETPTKAHQKKIIDNIIHITQNSTSLQNPPYYVSKKIEDHNSIAGLVDINISKKQPIKSKSAFTHNIHKN